MDAWGWQLRQERQITDQFARVTPNSILVAEFLLHIEGDRALFRWGEHCSSAAETSVPLRLLAAALDADVRLTSGHDLGSLWFEAHAA
ncbi:hypothetical protein [Nonomuraea sp. NPDC049141]|uniref:hypothetical protein n=1 Tax=Nonomuraea sp. NPDC049141 TaxID=3155500 RepID=UPI00340A195C